LRAFRALRLAVTLDFSIDDRLWGALSDEGLHSEIAERVSLSRVSGEVKRGLESPDPVAFLQLLSDSKLYRVAFPLSAHGARRLDEGLSAARHAFLEIAAPQRPWYLLLAAYIFPQLEAGPSVTTDAFLAKLDNWAYGRDLKDALKRIARVRSSFPSDPFDPHSQLQLVDWLLSIGQDYWRTGVCLVCAGRSNLPVRPVIEHVENNLTQFFTVKASLTGKDLLQQYPTLQKTPNVLNPILHELLLFEIQMKLTSQTISIDTRDHFLKELIESPYMFEH